MCVWQCRSEGDVGVVFYRVRGHFGVSRNPYFFGCWDWAVVRKRRQKMPSISFFAGLVFSYFFFFLFLFGQSNGHWSYNTFGRAQ